MRKFVLLTMAALLALPFNAAAANEDAMIQELQKQIQELSEELEELSDRLDKPERHAALDRLEITGDLRQKADSLHYRDLTVNQGFLVDFDDSFDNVTAPFNGGTPMAGITGGNLAAAEAMVDGFKLDPTYAQLFATYPGFDQALAYYLAFPSGALGTNVFANAPANGKRNKDNNILYTSRLRLNTKAKIWDNVKFNGRLTMYKNWGDSSGVKVFDSFDSFTMDGTNSGNTTGDLLHVDRAFFDWSKIGGTPFYLSIGRRPSTYGIPTNYRENELRGGTPTGNVMNLNFDGITVGYGLEDATGIPGFTARLCYGQGFESEYGNGSLFAEPDAKDSHFAGFNIDFYNDGYTILQATLFRVWDLADAFKGLAVLPFADQDGDGIPDDMNNGAFISRLQGQKDIGDMYLAGLAFAREEMNGFTWFVSGGWTQTRPSNQFNPMGLGGLLYDATPVMEVASIDADYQGNPVIDLQHTGEYVRSDDWDKNRNGWGVYVGIQTPAPLGKFGLEYNYGSKYWTPFTQAQDDVAGSKLATRGHVGEAYYIFDINPRTFIKVGAIYYDYEYTGSGSPVGLPKKVEDVQDGKEFSLFPVVDELWDLNASITMKF